MIVPSFSGSFKVFRQRSIEMSGKLITIAVVGVLAIIALYAIQLEAITKVIGYSGVDPGANYRHVEIVYWDEGSEDWVLVSRGWYQVDTSFYSEYLDATLYVEDDMVVIVDESPSPNAASEPKFKVYEGNWAYCEDEFGKQIRCCIENKEPLNCVVITSNPPPE